MIQTSGFKMNSGEIMTVILKGHNSKFEEIVHLKIQWDWKVVFLEVLESRMKYDLKMKICESYR